MNEISKLFSDLTDEQLKQAILEMKEDEVTGIIRNDGWVRKLTKDVCDITNENNISTHLDFTQSNLFREAAYRFVK